MAWTAPRTWAAGEVVTAALMNTHVRDNLRYMKGLDGAVAIGDDLTVDNLITAGNVDGVDVSAHKAGTAKAQHTGGAGTHTHQSAGAEGGKVDHGAALDGLADDDHTQYVLRSILTTDDDIFKRTGGAIARLAKGSNDQVLTMVANAIAWAGAPAGEGHVSLSLAAYDTIGQGTWLLGTLSAANSEHMGTLSNGTADADDDNITYKAYLAAGTYTLMVLSRKLADCGVLDVYIDAAEVASFDLYSAGDMYNVINEQANIAVAASGLKSIVLRIDGKNGSSSSYRADINQVVFWRQS